MPARRTLALSPSDREEQVVDRTEMETIIYEKDGAVARIVLNLPEKANIQTAQQVWDFEDALNGPIATRRSRSSS